MKKQQYLDKLEALWAKFNESFAGLTDDQLTEPGVTGDWSVKDILAHVSWWEDESIKHLPMILQGEQPPRYSRLYGGIDAFNALMTEQWRELTLPEVRQRLEATHKNLMDYLHSVPEDQYAKETRFRRRLGWDSYKHYPLHTQAIQEWREHLS
jgi:hypothetical protein